MAERLVAPTFLFHFAAPCLRQATLWSDRGAQLDESHRIASFGELDGRRLFADVRAGWSPQGLALSVCVKGKKQPPWCRPSKIEDSDGLQVWIDTRDTHNIHRAGRFCHRFAFLPLGGGPKLDQPIASMLPIHRSREQPRRVPDRILKVRSRQQIDGYLLEAHLPAEALTGFDPAEHSRLGFTYAVIDRELGWQTFGVGPEYPFMEDPSLWGSLELTP